MKEGISVHFLTITFPHLLLFLTPKCMMGVPLHDDCIVRLNKGVLRKGLCILMG